jgi:hypothetical protein
MHFTKEEQETMINSIMDDIHMGSVEMNTDDIEGSNKLELLEYALEEYAANHELEVE